MHGFNNPKQAEATFSWSARLTFNAMVTGMPHIVCGPVEMPYGVSASCWWERVPVFLRGCETHTDTQRAVRPSVLQGVLVQARLHSTDAAPSVVHQP